MANRSSDYRQEKVAQILAENPTISLGKAILQAGYSKSLSRQPTVLTRREKFQKLLNKHLPDKLLTQKHKELLTIPKIIRTRKNGKVEFETEQLDSQAIAKGLELAYKLKGSFAPEEHKNYNLNASVSELLNKLQNEDDTTYKPSPDNSVRPESD